MVNPEIPSWRKTVQSEIVAVTVYADRALVTRRGVVDLTGIEQELVITSMPETLETESIRVSGTGTVAVRLMGVSSDRIYTTEPVAERVANLTRQIEQLEAEKRHLQAQVDALVLQSSFIAGLREKTEEPFAQSLSRKNLSLSETLDFLNFIGSQYSEYAIASGECKTQQQELDKELQALRASLQKIQTPHPKESLSIVIGVEVAGEGEFELEVSYIVNRASWTPLYDLRFNTTSDIVHLGYLAEITQSSGEDWIGANLTLSTAKPGLGTLPPKLEPWYIDAPRPQMLRQRQLAAQRPLLPTIPEQAAPTAKADWQEEDEGADDVLIPAESVTAEVSKEGSVVTFKLNGGGNIPSDGAPHKTTIFNDDYPCNFDYVAMPRLVSFAYLQANVKNNPNGATLLPGKANIFRNNVFIGTTQLQNIAPGQEFKLNLGIDESLKIERELVERLVDKRLISNQRRITYSYRLIITNLFDKEVNLKVTEQLPVSRNEQIKVRLSRSNPQIQLGEMGILEWQLTLPLQETRDIYYQFNVEHPPDLMVVGLDI
ncbi:mucoidy inhibitor MuiA family protein [Nostoc sp. UCD121]|uniref:mucoidy inhibitor MuiA family protein n=1 Tax=unclassified Nostoc TaxID=2593658 RepID=UPI001623E629|nr:MULTISPECIES: mucoidy inhibitor MuiA family protein [unclassified Nostoc]MBC1223799.1 mucoidy inhibitor MuiA family protein [Nostoc sp. UCD120]MBC1277364.1 mucoidy inhibitor MuiA family protein [Nostoc sp. UCD121]MBC1298460.1 mucoidy inhibitor MuiA family protein [Nostoc sp. UCD122]